jgi:transcriptional regulator with XRE-family HTH domain
MPKPRPFIEVHGYALRVIREARGRKPAELAKALNVDRTYIVHLEMGNKRRVSPEFYAALLTELAVSDHRALLAVAPFKDAA